VFKKLFANLLVAFTVPSQSFALTENYQLFMRLWHPEQNVTIFNQSIFHLFTIYVTARVPKVFLAMCRVSLWVSLAGRTIYWILSLNFGLSFKIVYCGVTNYKNFFGYINTTELLVHACTALILNTPFSYPFGSQNVTKNGNWLCLKQKCRKRRYQEI